MLKRAILTASLLLAGTSPALARPVSLTLLHSNDVHSHLLPADSSYGKDIGGAARRATLIATLKRQLPNVLVLDAGDSFQGTPFFNFFKGAPEYDTLDEAGYDATTVGNHDLDDGLGNLEQEAKGRHFLEICSNLVDPRTHKPIFLGSHVFVRGGLKIGVFGVLGEDALGAVAKAQQRDFTYLPSRTVAQRMALALRKQADLVVMLSHSGLDEDTALAQHVRGIDVIIGGHSHTKVDHPVAVMDGPWRTLVVQAYAWGDFLGRLDLTVDHDRIVRYDGSLIRIDAKEQPDPVVAATVDRFNARIAKQMDVVVGSAPAGLTLAGNWKQDCPVGDWTADIIRQRTGADIGIMNAGGLRGQLEPGPVTVRDIYTVFPFDDSLATLDMSGSLIQQLLDAQIAKHDPGALQFSGLTFSVQGNRAIDVQACGQPLDPSRTYHVATIGYIAQGNDGNTLFLEGRHYRATGEILHDAVLAALKVHPTIVGPKADRITVPGGGDPGAATTTSQSQ